MATPAGIQNQAAEIIAAASPDAEVARLVDLRVIWREWGDSKKATANSPIELDPYAPIIMDAGGRWDRRDERYVGDGKNCLFLHFQPAQYEAAHWFAGWLRAYIAGGQRPPAYHRVWTMLNVGGRRGGKTDFAVKAQLALCAARADSMCWAASPTEDETIELHDVFSKIIPEEWAEYRETKLRWYFANGSVIEYRSGFKPKALRRGRVDLPFFNEAQYFARRSYNAVRPPIADRGGLVLMAGNPPDEPIGQWLLEMYDEAKAGKETVKLCEFDPDDNPMVDRESLEDLKEDLGLEDYRRDAKGEFIPIGDLVWYAWSPRYNIAPAGQPPVKRGEPPIYWADVTREVTKKHLGRAFDYVAGLDFQLVPHMSASIGKFYRDPLDPLEPVLWLTDEAMVEGTEDELAELILDYGYDPDNIALICDASGWWQDAERTKGRGSVDVMKAAGFRFCYRPDKDMKKNPQIFERVQACNARICNTNRRRRVYSVRENLQTCRALKSWENRNGVPYRRSDFAHFSDSVSYIVWRFFPRKKRQGKFKFKRLHRKRSGREKSLDGL